MSSTTVETQHNPQPQDVTTIRVFRVVTVTYSFTHGEEASQIVDGSWTRITDQSQTEEVTLLSFNEANTTRNRPASKLAVDSLGRKIYNKTYDVAGTCTICLEDFDDGKKIATLPCGHKFDDKCIEEWFMSSHVCPLCRFELSCEV